VADGGARRAVAAIAEAGGDQVWTFGELVPASFWGRRMAHETLVHAADAELAAGRQPDIAPRIAADAIDEWLTVISGPLYGRPDPARRRCRPAASCTCTPPTRAWTARASG